MNPKIVTGCASLFGADLAILNRRRIAIFPLKPLPRHLLTVINDRNAAIVHLQSVFDAKPTSHGLDMRGRLPLIPVVRLVVESLPGKMRFASTIVKYLIGLCFTLNHLNLRGRPNVVNAWWLVDILTREEGEV